MNGGRWAVREYRCGRALCRCGCGEEAPVAQRNYRHSCGTPVWSKDSRRTGFCLTCVNRGKHR